MERGAVKIIWLMLMTIIGSVPLWGGDNEDYRNYLYYNSHLNYVRLTADRGAYIREKEAFSTIMDLKVGKVLDPSTNRSSASLLLGMGLVGGNDTMGMYALFSSTDLAELFTFTNGNSMTAGSLGIGIGILPFFMIQGDLTLAWGQLFYYTRLTMPIIKSSLGMGISPFTTTNYVTNGVAYEVIQRTEGRQYFNVLKFDSAILQYVHLGFDYFRVKRMFSPYFSLSVHQFLPYDLWGWLPATMFVYVQPNIQFSLDSVKLTGVNLRFKVWAFPIRSWGFHQRLEGGLLMAKGGLFVAVSYKSPPENTEAVKGESGWGFEIGAGMCILDSMGVGFHSDFINFSYFVNYSEYFDVYPVIYQGVRVMCYF